MGALGVGSTALVTEFLTATRLPATAPAPLVSAAGAVALLLLGSAIRRL